MGMSDVEVPILSRKLTDKEESRLLGRHRVSLARRDVSEESIVSVIREKTVSELGTLAVIISYYLLLTLFPAR
jgi:hypothetical protein